MVHPCGTQPHPVLLRPGLLPAGGYLQLPAASAPWGRPGLVLLPAAGIPAPAVPLQLKEEPHVQGVGSEGSGPCSLSPLL